MAREYVKKVNTRHRALMRELVAGTPPIEAAERLGFSHARVKQLLCSALFRKEMARLSAEVEEKFAEAEGGKQSVEYHRARILSREVGPSIDTLVRLRDTAESERVRQISAMDLLDRAGLKHRQEVDLNVTAVEVSDRVKALLDSVAAAKEKGEESA